MSASFLEARKHSILLAGWRVTWQKQGTEKTDWPATFSHPSTSKPHTKGRNSTKKGDHDSSKSLISRFRKTSRLYSSPLQCRDFSLVYCYIVEKYLKFEGIFSVEV